MFDNDATGCFDQIIILLVTIAVGTHQHGGETICFESDYKGNRPAAVWQK
jgi:hypothetical protein